MICLLKSQIFNEVYIDKINHATVFREYFIKVTFARNLAKTLSPVLFQLSVANPEIFEEFKAREVLKIIKEKTGVSPTSLALLA